MLLLSGFGTIVYLLHFRGIVMRLTVTFTRAAYHQEANQIQRMGAVADADQHGGLKKIDPRRSERAQRCVG